jgi:hypothetical protein
LIPSRKRSSRGVTNCAPFRGGTSEPRAQDPASRFPEYKWLEEPTPAATQTPAQRIDD